MLRSLVGSEMCIRDRYQRRVRGAAVAFKMQCRSLEPSFNVRSYDRSGNLINPYYAHVAAFHDNRPKVRPIDRNHRDAVRLLEARYAGLTPGVRPTGLNATKSDPPAAQRSDILGEDGGYTPRSAARARAVAEQAAATLKVEAQHPEVVEATASLSHPPRVLRKEFPTHAKLCGRQYRHFANPAVAAPALPVHRDLAPRIDLSHLLA
eukprot:TRINITY_DN45589_c0_g1_i2.p1 TRINITY_DN45589_c0_g1~~TRINITY_DN45589_c0_g1_i2.p1  ORF type:complete len:207 (-),score=38.63 TRINITY_DN45589_c0_g1_i2:294-914(-)